MAKLLLPQNRYFSGFWFIRSKLKCFWPKTLAGLISGSICRTEIIQLPLKLIVRDLQNTWKKNLVPELVTWCQTFCFINSCQRVSMALHKREQSNEDGENPCSLCQYLFGTTSWWVFVTSYPSISFFSSVVPQKCCLKGRKKDRIKTKKLGENQCFAWPNHKQKFSVSRRLIRLKPNTLK